MPAKKSRRTYTAKKPRAKRSVSKRKKSLPIKAFQKSIGKKFQSKELETHDETDKKSKSPKRRAGL